jgi:hypothetical protein
MVPSSFYRSRAGVLIHSILIGWYDQYAVTLILHSGHLRLHFE